MSKWKFMNTQEPLNSPPEGSHGFIYMIKWPEGYYIGAKSFWSTTNRKISKKRQDELYKGSGPRKKKEKVTKESNWEKYCSSSREVQALVKEKGEDYFEWWVLSLASNKTELAYLETQYILSHECLRDPLCVNQWVKATIYRYHLPIIR